MIQRIQTLFLLLAAGGGVGALLLPYAKVQGDGKEAGILADGLFDAQDHIALLVLFGLAAAIALIAIFLFKNRPLQMTFCWIDVLIFVGGLGFGAYLLYEAGGFEEPLLWGFGLLPPLLGIVFALLARNYIHRDHKLVRSMDRLR